tara:strand:+ start:350 stop:1054 length:705 start_codon:yes stop_codon:yes gene_type:complete
MKQFKIDIPKSLRGIPLKEYQRFYKISEENKDAQDPEFLNLKMLEIFCGLSLKEAYNMKLTDFSFIINHLNELFKQETPMINRFSLKDPKGDEVEFGFIPRLDDISLGEFVDLDTYISDWDNMHKAMAVLYRPVTFDKRGMYLIEDYESSDKYSEVMKDMPIDIAIGAVVFFYRLGKELSIYLTGYLKEQMKKEDSELRQALDENGVGINQFMQSLKETSSNLKRLHSLRSHKP